YRFTVYFTSSIASGGRRGHARALQSVCSKHQFDDQLTKPDSLNTNLSFHFSTTKKPDAAGKGRTPPSPWERERFKALHRSHAIRQFSLTMFCDYSR
ncbi:MAG: hypothetical protein SPE19_00215, partial [Candidatus Faecousia sp.]|nr:hypothetical protein [Candidatus Faecousia sp.]